MSGKYVAYYRVSTQKQGKSGLGLDVQKDKVHGFLGPSDTLIKEFVEVETGSRNARVELEKAIRLCKQEDASLLIHKLDRFSRRVSFISSMMEQGIRLTIVDMPNATDFQLHIFAALSQEERRLISERTKSALQKAKERGVELGKNGKILAERRKQESRIFAQSHRSIILELKSKGLGFSGIARHLNSNGYKGFKGGLFYPSTVRNMMSVL
jgi:DNA invertase Pin-like site-specific DNA recombinase